MLCRISGFAPGSTETERSPIGLEEFFQITVLSTNGLFPVVDCRMQILDGRRIVATLSTPVVPDACIRIDCKDAALYGEVLGCWQEGSSIFGAIELHQAVTGLSELSAMRREFENPPLLQDSAHQLTA
jgi:hypothetical protein